MPERPNKPGVAGRKRGRTSGFGLPERGGAPSGRSTTIGFDRTRFGEPRAAVPDTTTPDTDEAATELTPATRDKLQAEAATEVVMPRTAATPLAPPSISDLPPVPPPAPAPAPLPTMDSRPLPPVPPIAEAPAPAMVHEVPEAEPAVEADIAPEDEAATEQAAPRPRITDADLAAVSQRTQAVLERRRDPVNRTLDTMRSAVDAERRARFAATENRRPGKQAPRAERKAADREFARLTAMVDRMAADVRNGNREQQGELIDLQERRRMIEAAPLASSVKKAVQEVDNTPYTTQRPGSMEPVTGDRLTVLRTQWLDLLKERNQLDELTKRLQTGTFGRLRAVFSSEFWKLRKEQKALNKQIDEIRGLLRNVSTRRNHPSNSVDEQQQQTRIAA